MRRSAAFLLYRRGTDGIEVLIVHPGGPYWAKKDAGAWSIPKGEYAEGEDPWTAAQREFAEELGQVPPSGDVHDLDVIRQAGGKVVRCFAVEGDLDVDEARSNEFELEWPPRSGRFQSFPEVDCAIWATPDVAREKLLKGQRPFVDRLLAALV
jgi:predicted NUDIX family NTP pyrophosphohydrolase